MIDIWDLLCVRWMCRAFEPHRKPSTAVYTHCLVGIVAAGQNAENSATRRPVDPEVNEDTVAISLPDKGISRGIGRARPSVRG